jgi:hypothetical protein
MSDNDKPLLILDLDETLIRGVREPLGRVPEMSVGPYSIYFRPFARDFLASRVVRFTLGFWSSSSLNYVGPICQELMKGLPEPLFVWDRSRCIQMYDFHGGKEFYLKDLSRVAKNGVDLARVLIVDDEPRKLTLNHGNAIYVQSFLGDQADEELKLLAEYLDRISDVQDFRRLDKQNWRDSLSV